MQVTLRQAHKIVDKLNAKIKSIDTVTTADINIWQANDTDAVITTLNAAGATSESAFARLVNLATIRHDIRGLIGVANHKAVDDLIARRKLSLDMLAIIRGLVEAYRPAGNLSPEVVVAQAAAARTANSPYSSQTITVNLYDEADIAELRKQIDLYQLTLEHIEEALTAANSDRSNQLDLSEFAEQLRAEGIVA